MRVLESIEELARIPGPLVAAIGVFDGVHQGHRAVIQRATDDARRLGGVAVVITFNPHPIRILRPQDAPRLLTSTQHKIALIKALGVGHLLIIPFDPAFAATPPEAFIRSLANACHPLKEICVGHQWSFGRGRAGNLELLRTLGAELGFEEVGVPAVEVDAQIVSSTLIRQAVERGDLDAATRLLGRRYSILGTVVEGDRIGRTLGFPTANLSAHNEQFPPDGVYVVDVNWKGQLQRGVVNIGVRPTIAHASGERIMEVHLLDFSGDLYGQDLELTFLQHLRGERRFESLDALKAQIVLDVQSARQLQ